MRLASRWDETIHCPGDCFVYLSGLRSIFRSLAFTCKSIDVIGQEAGSDAHASTPSVRVQATEYDLLQKQKANDSGYVVSVVPIFILLFS